MIYGPRMAYGPKREDETVNVDQQLDTLASGLERETVGRVYEFMLVLRAADLAPPDEDEYWERPWKWDVEYRHWIAAGRPDTPDIIKETAGLKPQSLAWERFVRACENEESW